MKTIQKKTKKTNQSLTPLQQQWKEVMERMVGKPVGIRVHIPYTNQYVSPVYNEKMIKTLIKMIPSDDVIRQYIQKVQNN